MSSRTAGKLTPDERLGLRRVLANAFPTKERCQALLSSLDITIRGDPPADVLWGEALRQMANKDRALGDLLDALLQRGCQDEWLLHWAGREVAQAPPSPAATNTIFCSYADEDVHFRIELETYLRAWAREGGVQIWHRDLIKAGDVAAVETERELGQATLILLLVSAYFTASETCQLDTVRAMARSDTGAARVVPILVRPAPMLDLVPFGKLAMLPPGGRPVSLWADQDEAWTLIAESVRSLAQPARP